MCPGNLRGGQVSYHRGNPRRRDTGPSGAEAAVAGLFAARYPELVRLAGLLGADDPEDIAQEAFARLLRRYDSLRDADAALGYVRATVCNLTGTGGGTCAWPGCGRPRSAWPTWSPRSRPRCCGRSSGR